ncbi:hypothetical protein BURPS406E_P0082 [Burkholderia pseudomallei 406e]|nr:hypothetical protein BURPS406E_P0082 [Burkholderia pseudomallei 406e]EDO92747.1 hypothetical protein BURPSPAST_E0069 [Burkholderia pseudomallei Pasteur 52237]
MGDDGRGKLAGVRRGPCAVRVRAGIDAFAAGCVRARVGVG